MSDSNTNLIECTYGKHMCSIGDFTKSGLNKKYFTQCRKCKAEQMKKYREKHNEKYNESRREYNREWMANKREREKQKIMEIEQKIVSLLNENN
jgi:hypothetical protein